MRRFQIHFAVAVVLGGLSWIPAQAADIPDGFKPLFNGKNLAGWQANRSQRGDWEVADGILRTEGTDKGWLFTEAEFDNFELRLEYKLGRGANSGVALRSPLQGEPAFAGMEVQLLDDAAYPDLKPVQYTGSIYNVVPRSRRTAKPAGEWNEMQIIAKGRQITVVLNGTQILDADLDDYKDRADKDPDVLRTKGYLALQTRDGRAEFRNMYVKRLGEAQASFSATETKGKPILVLDSGGHTDSIPMVLFTPDGKEVISISKDKTIRTWSVATGKGLRTLRLPIGTGRRGTLYAGALSPDGRTLAVGGIGAEPEEFPVILLDYLTGRIKSVLKGHTATVIDIDISPDGKWVASAGEDRTIRVWDLQTGRCEQVLQGHNGWIYDIAFSPDSKRLVSAAFDASARVWSLATSKTETVLKDAYEGRYYWVFCCAWSPDGKTIATGSGDECLRIWNADGTLRKRYGPLGDVIRSVAFTPDSREVLITRGYDLSKDCSLLNVATGKERVTFTRHTSGVWEGALSPRGDLAATAGVLGEDLFVWRTSDGSLVHHLGGRGQVTWSAAWSPDGESIAWGTTGKRAYDNAFQPLLRSFRLDRLEFGETPTDKYLRAKTRNGNLSLHRVPQKDAVAVRDGDQLVSTLQLSNNPLTCFTFVGANRVVAGGFFGAYLFDTRSGKQLRAFQGHTGNIWAISPSPDNRLFVSAAADETVRVWTLDRDEPLLSLFFTGDEWVAWTPEGYYAASPGGESLMGWQVNNGFDQLATFHPAAQFRKTLYRPDVIKRLLAAGSLEKALAAADQERGQLTRQTGVAQVLPPLVAITKPTGAGRRVTEARMEVEAVASSVGNYPVTSLRLLLDGRPCPGTDNLVTIQTPKRGKVTTTWKVTLPPGPHRLTVRATSAVSQAVSDEVEVTYAPVGSTTVVKAAGNLYLLGVGINAYPRRDLQLEAAVPDAQLIEKTFKQYSKPLFQQVQTRMLLDKEATRTAILAGFDWLQKQAKAGDLVVFFYAGHGDSKASDQLHLLPVDFNLKDVKGTGISGDALRTKLGNLPCATLVILDACFSGSFTAGKRKRALPTAADATVRQLLYDEGLVVMCGAAHDQEAAEEKGHGYFTRSIAEGLSGKAPRDEDGIIDLDALQLYVARNVKKLSGGEQEATIHRPSTVRNFALAKP